MGRGRKSYICFRVTGTGDGRTVIEEGMAPMNQDLLVTAIRRNHELAGCNHFKLEEMKIFHVRVDQPNQYVGRGEIPKLTDKGYEAEKWAYRDLRYEDPDEWL